MNRITDDQARSEDPFDTDRWRGGIAFIGDLQEAVNESGIEVPSGNSEQ